MPVTPQPEPHRPQRNSAQDARLWDVVRAEMAALLDHDEGYYAQRPQRGVVLESYEEAVLAHLRRTVEPGDRGRLHLRDRRRLGTALYRPRRARLQGDGLQRGAHLSRGHAAHRRRGGAGGAEGPAQCRGPAGFFP